VFILVLLLSGAVHANARAFRDAKNSIMQKMQKVKHRACRRVNVRGGLHGWAGDQKAISAR
jgi:hypothetical protein